MTFCRSSLFIWFARRMPRMLRLFLVWELHKKAKQSKAKKRKEKATRRLLIRVISEDIPEKERVENSKSLFSTSAPVWNAMYIYCVFWRKSWHRILYKQLWKTFAAASRNISLGLWLWSFGLIVSKHRPGINIVCKDKNISNFQKPRRGAKARFNHWNSDFLKTKKVL